MFCKYCGNEIQKEQEICLNCLGTNPDYKTKKNIILCMIIGISALISIVVYVGIIGNDSSSKTSVTSSTSEPDVTSKDISEDIIFDTKKLIGAKKQDVDVLLNIKGIQDTNEPYVYHYGDDTDVVYDDNGICLDLCLDTDGKEYKSYDETKIFKSYGIDLTDAYYKQSNEFLKTYTKTKDFGEIDVFYDSRKGGSLTDIKQIVFYTKSSKELNDFLEKKSESFENELDNKLIEARYGDNDKIAPDKDIKNSTKVDNESSSTSNLNSTNPVLTSEEAIEIVKKAKNVDENVSSVRAYSDLDRVSNGVKYYYIEMISKGGRGAASTCYVNSQTGAVVDYEYFNDVN